MSVSIASGSSLFPSVFQSVSFIYGENTTSIKLNTFSNYISSQNNLLGQGIGNIFALGESSIAGTIGDPRTITPTSFSSSDSAINIIAPIYTNSNFYFNELPCTTAINGSNTIITLNANNVINGSIASNFIGTGGIGITTPILNILLVSKSGNQVATIYPGSFQTPSGWSLGTDITSITLVGQQLVPGSYSYYIEIPNFSISSSLVNIMTNEGDMIFSRGSSTTAYIDNSNDDTFDQFASNKTATITNMVNRIDAKIFTIRLHIRVPIGSFDSQDGTNRYWSITQSSAPNINSANPSVATIQNYIKYNLISYPPQANSASYDIFAAANGAVILSNTGTIIAPFISYTTGVLTIGLSLAAIANLTSSVSGQIPLFIDFYIPVSVPYYALQSRALNYDKEKIQVEDLLKNVIGYQYGWGGISYPDTIGNRLGALETNLGSLNAFQYRNKVYTTTGTNTFTAGSNTNAVMVDIVSAGGGGGSGNTPFGGSGGGSGAFSRILTTVTPNATYTIVVGAGGAGNSGGAGFNGSNGGSSSWAGNFGTFTVTGGNGGLAANGGGGNGGTALLRLPTVTAGALVLLSYNGSVGATGATGNVPGVGGTLSAGGNAAFTSGIGGAANTNGGTYAGGGGGNLDNSGNGGTGGAGLVIVYY